MSNEQIAVKTNETEPEPPPPPPRPKSRLPDTPFSQQRLPAWEPIINIRTIWMMLVVFGLICTPLGAFFLYVETTVTPAEIEIKYTNEYDCLNCANKLVVKRGPCSACVSPTSDCCECDCKVEFEVPYDMQLPVYMYYQLENFHQNHRRYVKSRDDFQLLGRIFKDGKAIEPDTSCAPFDRDNGTNLYYFPCGAIANSMFNDVLAIESDGSEVALRKDNIVWPLEKKYKFKNPPKVNKDTYNKGEFVKHFSKPKDWTDKSYEDWWRNGGVENEHFINWMHPAFSPKFRKLYGIIEKKVPGCKTSHSLCKKKYTLKIKNYRFDVARFNGEKYVILAKTSFLGGRNPFIGWFTVGLGVLTLVIGGVFALIHQRHKKRVHPGHRRLTLNAAYGPFPVSPEGERKKSF